MEEKTTDVIREYDICTLKAIFVIAISYTVVNLKSSHCVPSVGCPFIYLITNELLLIKFKLVCSWFSIVCLLHVERCYLYLYYVGCIKIFIWDAHALKSTSFDIVLQVALIVLHFCIVSNYSDLWKGSYRHTRVLW